MSGLARVLLLAALAAILGFDAAAVMAQEAPPSGTIVALEVVSDAASILAASRQAITARVGDAYRIDTVRDSLQALWTLGLIEDASVRVVPEAGGVRLRFELQPRVRLWNVRFRGDVPIRRSRLQRGLTLRPGQPLDEAEAARQASRVQRLLSDAGYLRARVSSSIRIVDRDTRGELDLEVEAGSLARLGEVRLEGTTGLSDAQLRDALGLRVGQPYRPSQLEEGLQRLDDAFVSANYFYRQVRVEEQSLDLATGDMYLVIGIDSGPRVDLELTGLELGDKQRRELLSIFEFGTVADWALKESRHEIVRLLQQRGHWRPLVTYGRQRDEEGRNVQVQLRVLPGDKLSLSRIEFTGAAEVDDRTLRDAIRTGDRTLLRSARFLSEYWEQDQNAVLSVMRRHGYRYARLAEAPVFVDAEGKLVARMDIDAGARFFVRDVELSVEPASEPLPGISVPIWLGALELRRGGPYDAVAANRDGDRLRAMLSGSGYERGFIESITEETPDGVVVRHRVVPGERARVTQVIIAGNDRTRIDAVRRELAFLVGSPWSFSDVLDSQSRLYRLGVFDEVDIRTTVPDPVTAERAVAVRVHEAPPKFYSFGLGYDTEERLRGSVAVGHNNLFGGGEQGSLSARLSTREQRVRLLLRDPWLLGRRVEGTATAFFSDVIEPSFKVQRYGGAYQVLLQQSFEVGHLARVAFRDVTTYEIKIDPGLIEPEDQATTVGSIGYTLFRDTRSDPIDPRDGSYNTVDVDVATRVLGSATDFMTLFGRSFWYREVGRGVVVALAARAGFKIAYAGTRDVPLPERFFTGGSTTLRGFGLDEAGPLDSNGNPLGGEAVLIGNAEIRLPLRGALGAVLFADVGNVFAKPRDVSWSEMREMAGIGARYATPVGPIRLDFTWLLDRRPGESATRLYFSVGHTF